jgi:prophage regulatory protein
MRQVDTIRSEVKPLPAPDDILRMSAVRRRTGLGRSTIYRLIAARRFPAPVRLTGRAVGWRVADLDRWTESLQSTGH